MNYNNYCNVNVLMGKTLSSISGVSGDDELVFVTTTGESYRMYHMQDCCENVYLEDVVGDLQDLVGSEILLAEEVSGEGPADSGDESYYESYTYTFYKFATRLGYVDLRWLGTSNGYYSEGVSFQKVED